MAPKDTHFTIKKGRIAAEPGTLLQESVPLGWELRDMGDMDCNGPNDFTVNVGDWVMFNWGPIDGGWMKGEVNRKCTSTRDIKKGCTHILRHAQLKKDRDWVVALKKDNYADGSNQPGKWAFIRRLK